KGRLQQAVRWGNWKALCPAQGQKLELYNLAKDVSEKQNVAALHSEVIAEIEAYLKTARTESPNWPTGE
ncbi:sulfatase, partial [bacterium]|nr:sulfatase [bacterium]